MHELGAGSLGNLFDRKVLKKPNPRRAVSEAAVLFSSPADKLADILHLVSRAGNDDGRAITDTADRHQIAQRVVAQLGKAVGKRRDVDAVDEQRAAVRLGIDRRQRADVSGRSGPNSTTTVRLSEASNRSARMRATASFEPPGGNGTMTFLRARVFGGGNGRSAQYHERNHHRTSAHHVLLGASPELKPVLSLASIARPMSRAAAGKGPTARVSNSASEERIMV